MMDRLVALLHDGGHTLVVANGEVRTFQERGVTDLYRLLTTDAAWLCRASVADKVVGKGAAALMILGGVVRLHTDVISKPALALLESTAMQVSYDRMVDYIANRTGDGCCPVETLCKDCKTAAECLPLIKEFMNNKQR